MKKIGLSALLISFMGLCCVPAFAATAKCGTNILRLYSTWPGTQDPWDNEFLYTNKDAYKQALTDYDADGDKKDTMYGGQYDLSPKSQVFECDNSAACPDGTLLYLPSKGGWLAPDAKDGTPVPGVFFKCNTSGDDRWEKVGDKLNPCRLNTKITMDFDLIRASDREKSLYKGKTSKLNYFKYADEDEFCKCGGDTGSHFYATSTDGITGECVADGAKQEEKKFFCEQSGKGPGAQITKEQPCKDIKGLKENYPEQYKGEKCKSVCVQNALGTGYMQQWVVTKCPDNTTAVHFGDDYTNKFGTLSNFQKYYMTCKTADGKVDPVKPEKKEKTCEESYKGNDEAIACCKFKYSNWQNGQCVCDSKKARWIYDSKNKTGFCKNESKKPEKPGKQPGKQSDKQPDAQPEQTPVTPVVTEEDCYYTLNIDVKCNNGKVFHKGESVKLTKEQVNKIGGCGNAQNFATQSIIDILKTAKQEYTASTEFIKLVCGDNATSISPISTGPSTDDVSDAVRTLEKFTSNANNQASVWKDADGNFNTARLASDLTAAVVLGTVGGVVSGVVIKKKQIGKGFEVLNCTVGGHKVAGWGDTFRVGLE